MHWTTISATNDMTLDEMIARLAEKSVVDGIVIAGSAAKGTLSESSDYDVIIILSEMPIPLRTAITYVDGRLTDIIFRSIDDVDRVGTEPVSSGSEEEWLVRWLQTGQIAFDRSGRLKRAQTRVQTEECVKTPSETYGYTRWFRANYNLKQTERIAASDDPIYLESVDFRMLYQLADLMVDYFSLRSLPWQGEKNAVRYWAAHDPSYLDLFRRCIDERDRQRRVELYEELVRETLAPIGRLWSGPVTAILPEGTDWEEHAVDEALNFWESLIATKTPSN